MFKEVTIDQVQQPFFIGEEIIFKAIKDELPEEILEDGEFIATVIGYKKEAVNSFMIVRYGYWKDDDTYAYRYFEIPHTFWDRIEELGEDEYIEELDKE